MDLINIDQLNDDALALTEKLLDNVSRAMTLSRKECMDVRQRTFPLVSRYLNEDHLSYHTSISVLSTLIDKADRWSLQGASNSGVYQISQKDINDGLKEYSQTEEFKNMIKNLHGGVDHWGQPKSAGVTEARKVLYHFVIAEMNGTEEKSKLDDKVHQNNERNDGILRFHAQRIVAILRQQPGSFFPPPSPTKKSKKDQAANNPEPVADTEAKAPEGSDKSSTVDDLVKQIEEMMEEASSYRIVVLNTSEMTVDNKTEPTKAPTP